MVIIKKHITPSKTIQTRFYIENKYIWYAYYEENLIHWIVFIKKIKLFKKYQWFWYGKFIINDLINKFDRIEWRSINEAIWFWSKMGAVFEKWNRFYIQNFN